MSEFIEEISRSLNQRRDLVETDYLLHKILLDLSRKKFSRKFAFKGGSCLVKHYLGYYRFSVDLDFTFLDQMAFKEMSQSKIRRMLSSKIDTTGELLEELAAKRGLEFKCAKGNRRYVELGGSNKFVTFKLWYPSILGITAFVKIQINYVERILFPIRKVELRSICPVSSDLNFLFPEQYNEYSTLIPFSVYDVKEILCEKIRAILTRRGFRERDFIDVYLIRHKLGLSFKDLKIKVIEKTRFALDLYKKYRSNLKRKIDVLNVESFSLGSERHFLINEIDDNDFFKFLNEFILWLRKLAEASLD